MKAFGDKHHLFLKVANSPNSNSRLSFHNFLLAFVLVYDYTYTLLYIAWLN